MDDEEPGRRNKSDLQLEREERARLQANYEILSVKYEIVLKELARLFEGEVKDGKEKENIK